MTDKERFRDIAWELSDYNPYNNDEPCHCKNAARTERIIPGGRMTYYYCHVHGKHWQEIEEEK